MKGSTSSEFEVDYYGRLEEVIELQYHSEQNSVFIHDKISDGNENYRQLVYRWTNAVGDTVDNNFTNMVHALNR